MYPLVRELAVDKIPVVVTCRVLGFSKQAYFKWLAKPVSDRDWADAHLINAAIDIHHDDPAFGYRFIADERPAVGITAGENRVARLCSQQRIFSIFAKKRGLNRKAGPPVHDDLVDREFTATAPNRLWLTDITEHRTGEGKLYLCAIKDVFSTRIVGYSIDSRMKASLAVTALRNAVALREPAGTIVHFDRLNSPSSGHTHLCGHFATPSSSARWDGSGHAETTHRWSRSLRCYKRMSSTVRPGRPARSCAWRSSNGSNAPTTVDVANAVSGASRPSNLR